MALPKVSTSATRPTLRYFGGKWRLAPWIISHFPEHVCYIEPFAGGASVLLRKKESKVEVLNDLDGEVVNFWRVLRERTDDFIRAIELTPFSKEEAHLAYDAATDPLERARRLFIRSWQMRGGPRAQWRSGWRHATGNGRSNIPAHDWAKMDHLWATAARLKTVQIENDDALTVIKRYDKPNSLYYIDPPYLQEVRSVRWSKKAYKHEMDDKAHQELAAVLRKVSGSVVVSGYASEMYEDLYKGWERSEMETMADSHLGAVRRTEVLWIKPGPKIKPRQLELDLQESPKGRRK